MPPLGICNKNASNVWSQWLVTTCKECCTFSSSFLSLNKVVRLRGLRGHAGAGILFHSARQFKGWRRRKTQWLPVFALLSVFLAYVVLLSRMLPDLQTRWCALLSDWNAILWTHVGWPQRGKNSVTVLQKLCHFHWAPERISLVFFVQSNNGESIDSCALWVSHFIRWALYIAYGEADNKFWCHCAVHA